MAAGVDDGLLGYELVGSGASRVLVLNDWLCDTSTWDGARPCLDERRFTYAFVDLRGYGRSRQLTGAFNLLEAVGDVLALADALGWARFSVVGHSMSALIALQLAQQHAERMQRLVLITPPPPAGFGLDEARLAGMQSLGLADDAARLEAFEQRLAGQLSIGWARYKMSRWRATSEPVAVAGYAAMFARDGLPNPTQPVDVAVLAITGEQDIPPMRSEAVTRYLSPLCRRLEVRPLAEVGHYPMQEMPPLTVTLMERFLGS